MSFLNILRVAVYRQYTSAFILPEEMNHSLKGSEFNFMKEKVKIFRLFEAYTDFVQELIKPLLIGVTFCRGITFEKEIIK